MCDPLRWDIREVISKTNLTEKEKVSLIQELTEVAHKWERTFREGVKADLIEKLK